AADPADDPGDPPGRGERARLQPPRDLVARLRPPPGHVGAPRHGVGVDDPRTTVAVRPDLEVGRAFHPETIRGTLAAPRTPRRELASENPPTGGSGTQVRQGWVTRGRRSARPRAGCRALGTAPSRRGPGRRVRPPPDRRRRGRAGPRARPRCPTSNGRTGRRRGRCRPRSPPGTRPRRRTRAPVCTRGTGRRRASTPWAPRPVRASSRRA